MTSSALLGHTTRLALALSLTGVLAAPLQAADGDLPPGHYRLPEDGDLIGEVTTVVADEEDTLIDIGHEHGIGYEAWYAQSRRQRLVSRRGHRGHHPGRFILPDAPRKGVVVNVAEMRLYYYPPHAEGEPATVETYPIAVGRMDWKTPLGTTTITEKIKDPAWYPPQSIIKEHAANGRSLPSVVPPGPDNPLGRYKMRLGIPGYLIHGTNKPEGVGMRVTHAASACCPRTSTPLPPLAPRHPGEPGQRQLQAWLGRRYPLCPGLPLSGRGTGTTIQRVTERSPRWKPASTPMTTP